MLSRTHVTDEAVGVVGANDGQGLITIDDFAQLNEKSVEGLCRVIRRPGGTTGGVSNPWVAVSVMAEVNLQGMIYYIKHFKRTEGIYTHRDVELSKARAMYHQRDKEESHKDPGLVPTINTRDWPKTLETVEDYTRGFCGVDGQPLSFRLRDYLIAPVDANDTTYRANGIE